MHPTEGTRLTFCLPVNTVAESAAARIVVAELNRRYGGATISLLDSPVFIGSWEDDAGNFIVDDVTLVIVDVRGQTLGDERFVSELEDLRAYLFRTYDDAGSPQAEVWLVGSPIQIFVT